MLSTDCHNNGNVWLFTLVSFLGSIWLLLAGLEPALASPIYINSIADLQNIQDDLSGDYVLASDIDASGYSFTPIGSPTTGYGFNGTLDGDGHTISNLVINDSANVGVGLFGYIDASGVVENLHLTNASVTGSYQGSYYGGISGLAYTGILAGLNGGTITNVGASGSVVGYRDTGGLVGLNGGTISRSSSTGSVTVGPELQGRDGPPPVAGGLVGLNANLNATIKDSYSLSSVGNLGNRYPILGGLVGQVGDFESGYATSGSIANSYAAGPVDSQAISGGLVGEGYLGDASTSYWDSQTTGQAAGIGFARGDSWDVTGLTTAELQSGTLPAGFDPSVWNASSGQYPTLKSQVLVDVSPPTVLTLANLSLSAYGTPVDLNGYNLVDSTDLSKGFGAIAYQDGNQIVIAIRGTQKDNITGAKDAFADASWITGTPSEAMASYVLQASQFLSEVHAIYPDANITLTGHSLGGAIAELLASVSGYSATTFDAPGPADLLSLLTAQLSSANDLSGGLSPTITNYRLWGDQISLFGTQLGSVQTVGPLNGSGLTTVTFSQAFADHSLLALIAGLNGAPIGPGDEGPTLTRSQLIFASAVATGLYLFTAQVEPGVDFGFDPIGASSYTFLEDPGSPFLETLMLPQIDGVAGYGVSEFDGEDWSLASFVDPNTLFDFDPEIIGFKFDALDDFGIVADIDGPILFDLTFRDGGTLTAELQVPVTSTVPEPSSLILVFLPLSILAFHAERSRRRREREYVQN